MSDPLGDTNETTALFKPPEVPGQGAEKDPLATTIPVAQGGEPELDTTRLRAAGARGFPPLPPASAGDPPPPAPVATSAVVAAPHAPAAPFAAPIAGSPQSPWTGAGLAPKQQSRTATTLLLVGAAALGLVAAALAFWVMTRGATPEAAPTRTSPPVSAATAASAPTPSEPAPRPESATAGSAPSASAATSPEPSATAPAAPLASAELPPIPDDPPGDGSALLSYRTYLIVRSSRDAEVVITGNVVGRTNRKLEVHCRQKNVRLREPATQRWLTKGEAVRIPCRTVHTVHLEPDG
jgi:hypothetical protein